MHACTSGSGQQASSQCTTAGSGKTVQHATGGLLKEILTVGNGP